MNALELSRELIRYDTINPPGLERACVEYLAGVLEGAGFTVRTSEYAPDRTSLVARLGDSSGRALAFAGHVDTVPLGAMPWTRDPFAGEIDAGRLYGRGSSDMKCGVAAFVTAACRLADRLRDTPGLVLVIVAGEETGCAGSQHLADTGALGSAGALVVAEPTANQLCVGHKGVLWLEARASGVTAHGAMPEQGVNAIYKAARAVGKLEHFPFDTRPHAILGSPTLNIGTFSGGLNVNSVPDRATFSLDIRTTPGQSHAELVERLRAHAGDEVVVTPVMDVQPVWTDPADPWIRQLIEVAEPILGARPEARGVSYFTDAGPLTPGFGGVPTVILGPGEVEVMHKTDEYCRIDRLEQAVELYVAIARRWCGI